MEYRAGAHAYAQLSTQAKHVWALPKNCPNTLFKKSKFSYKLKCANHCRNDIYVVKYAWV
jgi:hypothetical protein